MRKPFNYNNLKIISYTFNDYISVCKNDTFYDQHYHSCMRVRKLMDEEPSIVFSALMAILYDTGCYLISYHTMYIHTFGLFDVIFDVKDKDGNLLLPFTKNKPFLKFLCRVSKYADFKEVCKYLSVDIEKIYSFNAGIMSNGLRNKIQIINNKHTIIQHFDEYSFSYDMYHSKGFMKIQSTNKVKEKLNNIKKRINILEQQIKTLYK